MEEAMVDVGPELFGNKRRSIDSNIQAPLSACVGKAPFARGIVETGEAGRGARANHLAHIEHFIAGVGSGDDGAAKGIGRSAL